MERRLLLVFALTFLVIILFQPLLKKYLPQSAAPAPEAPVAAQPSGQPAATAAPSFGSALPARASKLRQKLRPLSKTIFIASPSPTAAAW